MYASVICGLGDDCPNFYYVSPVVIILMKIQNNYLKRLGEIENLITYIIIMYNSILIHKRTLNESF